MARPFLALSAALRPRRSSSKLSPARGQLLWLCRALREGAIFAASNKLPPPLQRFSVSGAIEAGEAPRIIFPPDGARLEIATGAQPDPVALKISGGRGPLTVLVNGVPLGAPLIAASGRGTLFFQPDGPGFVRLTVMDARGASDSVTVRLQ